MGNFLVKNLRIYQISATTLFLLLCCPIAQADEDPKILRTKFTTIRYSQEAEIGGFLWRISGQRPAGPEAIELTRNRVDEIVERVQSLLDMYPSSLGFEVFLTREYPNGQIAVYSHSKRAITVCLDRVTDGVFAHEVAHAVINQYFTTVGLPAKVQEVLAQYVDRHLWTMVV